MKKIFFIGLMSVMGFIPFTACTDALDSDRYFKDRVTLETVFTDRNRTEQWLAYAYSFLRDRNADVVNKDPWTNPFCFADDLYYGDHDGDFDLSLAWEIDYNEFKLGEFDETYSNEAWGLCYKGIYQASIFIHHIDMNPTMTPEEKLDYKGQARFVRAYFYWLLLRRYGPCCIMPDEGVDYTLSYEEIATPRSSYEEVAEYISNEMLQAAQELQYNRRTDPQTMARPTRGAALATRAYALIFAASPFANGNDDEYARQLVDDQGRRLLSPKYDEKKWARAAAACRDVMELKGSYYGKCYDLYHVSRTSSDGGMHARPTITPPDDEEGNFSEQNWPNGWANIDPLKSYRDLFDGTALPTSNPELIFSRLDNYEYSWRDPRDFVLHQMPRSEGGRNTQGLTQKMVDAYYMADGSNCPGMNSMYADVPAYTSAGRVDPRPRTPGYVTEENRKDLKYSELLPGVSMQYAEREPRFYASVAYNGAVWYLLNAEQENLRNKQIFYYRGTENGYINSPMYLRSGVGSMKYVNPSDIASNIRTKYEPAIRYADILLLYAEALNELDGSYQIPSWDGQATYEIRRDIEQIKRGTNPVRIRAGLCDYSTETYTDKAKLRTALKRERMIEFMCEGKRYFDIRRWKDLEIEDAVPIYGCNITMDEARRDLFHVPVPIYNLTTSFVPKMYLWPIAHHELKHNSKLTQNPGWTMFD